MICNLPLPPSFLPFLSLSLSYCIIPYMASFERSSEHMIIRHEKIRLVHVLSLLVRRRRIGDHEFVECSEGSAKQLQEANAIPNWRTVISLIALWFLKMIGGALSLLGVIVQFSLNFYSLNGGVLGLIRRILTGSVVIPQSDSKDFKSIIGFIDGRLDLYKASSLLGYFPLINDMGKSIRLKPLDMCMMAAKVVYENEAYIQNAVTSHWKMHLAGFFNCWNEFQGSADTQVIIFCDQPEDAKTIIVAFRGTEPFNAKDWSTDIDFSWISMGKMGKAHLGFMKALGIQNEHDYVEGWPNELKQEKGKPLAYYSIRETLKSLLLKHKSAKIVVTGHSLGGALAAVFPSILYLHGENDILNRMSVITFGQPRVGDETFANFMESEVGSVYKMNFVRVVYRYDLVPRVPFDSNLFKFKHFGYCFYFNGWYHGEALDEEPNRNYFSPKYLFSKYMNAWGDLIKALFIGIKEGKDFREGGVSLSFRLVGLLFPGLASHSPRDYLNAARLGKIIVAEKEMV